MCRPARAQPFGLTCPTGSDREIRDREIALAPVCVFRMIRGWFFGLRWQGAAATAFLKRRGASLPAAVQIGSRFGFGALDFDSLTAQAVPL